MRNNTIPGITHSRIIGGWDIDELKSIGCDDTKSVLAIGPEELTKRAKPSLWRSECITQK